jgi:hypothetical protein
VSNPSPLMDWLHELLPPSVPVDHNIQ